MNKISLLFLMLLISACANAPSITNNDNVKDIPDGYESVSICHSGEASEKTQIEELALRECPAGTGNLHVWDFDWFMNACPVTKRKRITFLCTQ